jgi:hypothetical protein
MPRKQPEIPSPQTALFAEVQERLKKVPFEPFRIVTTSGESFSVPTFDHAIVWPLRRVIYVQHDQGWDYTQIHALHVSAITNIPRGRSRKKKRAA